MPPAICWRHFSHIIFDLFPLIHIKSPLSTDNSYLNFPKHPPCKLPKLAMSLLKMLSTLGWKHALCECVPHVVHLMVYQSLSFIP